MNPRQVGQLLVDAGSTKLWQQAQTRLLGKLSQNPNDLTLLSALADLQRQQGRLVEASESLRRICEIAPDDPHTACLHAAMAGLPLSATNAQAKAFRPAPFAKVSNFLPDACRDQVFDMAVRHQAQFKPLEVYGVGQQRQDELLPQRRMQTGMTAPADMDAAIRPRVRELLPEIFNRLQLAPFEFRIRPMQLTACLDGDFGAAHRDDAVPDLKVAFLYYFHQHPKSFTGGDLLLFDTNTDARTFHPGKFTRILHEDNLLLLFPCNYYHQITKVVSSSSSFAEARFAVCGTVLKV